MQTLPAIALRSITVMPGMNLSFDISRKASVTSIELAVEEGQQIFLIAQKNPNTNEPGQEDLVSCGTISRVRSIAKNPKNVIRVSVEGIRAARLVGLTRSENGLQAQVEEIEPEPLSVGEIERDAMGRALKDLISRYSLVSPKMTREVVQELFNAPSLEALIAQAQAVIPFHYMSQAHLLEISDTGEKYDALTMLLVTEIEVLSIRNEIQQKVRARLDKNQREYILREQMKVIQEELGENNLLSEAENYKTEAGKLEASEEVKQKICKEADRLKGMGMNNAESTVVRSYLDTLLEMPWDKMSEDNNDLKNAQKILEEDHYGLEKVKERILEFLAVRSLTKKGESPILCLVGPPGTGKTSVARSIARALNKKYVRISLGGVRDEAEIRGHRRTYIGAMPGRIASAMRQAGVKNPLMLLDEIDKVSSDYKGDTSSALLEVLDSEQNVKFKDHYVELPIDLSEVLFICTANDTHTISRPLLDRMEVIEITSYTENEKLHIAREHLMKKQLEHNGLTAGQLTITKSAMARLIRGYTREAGVRQLERRIGEICRKAARQLAEDPSIKLRVTEKNLPRYLGKERYTFQPKNEENEIGIVRGLAWTSVGGDTLQIEVNIMPGKGEFLLTGQMGDVMKESARTGISYVRSIAGQYGVEPEFFQKNDIHIHIPEGAVPKDGPSAGITMATAILSAAAGIPVRADLAMTGEITLRGRVLAVGGLKEKLLAAATAGMSTVLVPWENQADIRELSEEITGNLKIKYMKTMDEVLKEALVRNA